MRSQAIQKVESDVVLFEQLALKRLKPEPSPLPADSAASVPAPFLSKAAQVFRFLGALASALQGVELVQEVAPNKQPLRRHEWEKPSERFRLI